MTPKGSWPTWSKPRLFCVTGYLFTCKLGTRPPGMKILSLRLCLYIVFWGSKLEISDICLGYPAKPDFLKERRADAITVLMKLFADDAKVYRSITNVRHVNQVQTSVDNAVTWTNIWEMMFNFKKCKHLHIGSRTIPANYTINSGQDTEEIEKVSYKKILGLLLIRH